MEFTFTALHIQQSPVFACSACIVMARTFNAAHFLFRLPAAAPINTNSAVCWDVTPCSQVYRYGLSTFCMNLLPPSSGRLYRCLCNSTHRCRPHHTTLVSPFSSRSCTIRYRFPFLNSYRVVMFAFLCVSCYTMLNQSAI
jgi:hypothetical protein